MAKGDFNAGKSIPLVFGFGLIVILFGTLLNQIDPNFPGHLNVDYSSSRLYAGQWFMIAGFVLWIAAMIAILIRRINKEKAAAAAVAPQTARGLKEDIPDFFTKYSSWRAIGIFGIGGLIGYFAITEFVPEAWANWAEVPFALAFLFGFSLLMWRLFIQK